MEYKLFDEYITLQALLKEVGIIQSGGAIKSFLADNQVFFNGELENRRGKNLELEMSSLSQTKSWKLSSLLQIRRKFLNIKRSKQRKKEWQT
ncbi:hypothetical protein I872_10605 [Streptococcus cristatus AS 1.3089]|uniref:S4 domain protein YaaA n=1 Tax=Streptococcus cristatus AS 1.3089 TaxID=1302863 RepID=A0ABM5NNQ7_STRCR|nr:hypothetical protein I872_10605 [Streptococcus cristatus AS 1.3089]